MLGGPDIIWGGVVPGLIAVTALAVVWKLTSRAASAWRTALVLGYLSGHWALSARDLGATALMRAGQLEQAGADWAYNPRNFDFQAAVAKSYQPAEAQDWLPALALLAMVPDAIACVGRFGPLTGWILRGALCAFLPWRLVYGSKYWPLSLGPGFDFDMGGWTNGEAACWIGGITATLLIAWQLTRLEERDDRPTRTWIRSAVASIVAFGSVIVLVASGSLVYGQLAGVLTAALAGCGLASYLFAVQRGPDAAAGPIVVTFGTLLAVGHLYAELSLTDAALLVASMVAAIGWLPLPKKLAERQNWCRTGACLLILAIPTLPAGRTLASQVPDTSVEQAPNPYENFSR
ncbi:MAG: hypothetical protein AAGD11_17120 [Planctomycetota bacterium]